MYLASMVVVTELTFYHSSNSRLGKLYSKNSSLIEGDPCLISTGKTLLNPYLAKNALGDGEIGNQY